MAPQEAELLVEGSDSDGVDAPSSATTHRLSGLIILTGLLAVGCLVGVQLSREGRREGVSRTSGIVGLSTLRQHLHKGHSKEETNKCSWGKENCNATQCCNNEGKQCYQQNKWYAQCRDSCTPDSPDVFHWDAKPWTCDKLGTRKEGDGKCSEIGEDCRKSGCCSTVNTQCFMKNKDWATCKSECVAGAPDLADMNGDPWNCSQLGPWTEGAAPWVPDVCSQDGEDCTSTKCCAAPGKQCFKQSDFWAQCKYDCQAGKDAERDWEPEWSCDVLGSRTPGADGMPAQKVGEWVLDSCADMGEDCSKSRCCLTTNTQCFAKNKNWAMCMETCSAGRHADDNNATWSCEVRGPKNNNGLAVKGTPSIFCWSLFQTTTYENDIIKAQVTKGTGIFECDEAVLLSTAEVTDMGKTPDGKQVKTLHVEPAEITQSVDGTAGNAQLFVNTWDAVLKDGRWKHHAWVVKVDPDAVIIPQRVRDHLSSHILENVYVVNCNKFPSSPNFPMMYGSVEIYSFKAIDTYERNVGQCFDDMGMMMPKWGEDYWMTHCLDHIGVGRISDFASVGDNVCTGGSCFDQYFSAFHPFKTVDSWQECWDQSHGLIKPPPPPVWD